MWSILATYVWSDKGRVCVFLPDVLNFTDLRFLRFKGDVAPRLFGSLAPSCRPGYLRFSEIERAGSTSVIITFPPWLPTSSLMKGAWAPAGLDRSQQGCPHLIDLRFLG